VNFVHVKRADGLPEQRVAVKQKVGLFPEWELKLFGLRIVNARAVFNLGQPGRPAERQNSLVPPKIKC
jgi:hypothetical protein